MLEKKYGRKEAAGRIYATTDKARGALKSLAEAEGYETFVVPDDVGGRFSVLTAVGLLPIAVSGADLDRLMEGAALDGKMPCIFHMKRTTHSFTRQSAIFFCAKANP